MPPAQQFAFYTAPGSTLPEGVQRWPQGVLFRRSSLYEYTLLDVHGSVFASLIWQGLAPPSDQSIWRLDVRQQPVAWFCCADWPVQAEGTAIMQRWFGGIHPNQQTPLGAVCWPAGLPPPTWQGIDPQPPPPPTTPPAGQLETTAGISLQDVLNEVRHLRDDGERRNCRDEEAWAAYEERAWYDQEERMSAYCEQSRQHAEDMAKQMQEANDGHLAQVESQCKALEEQSEARHKVVEESCKEAVESLGQRCQQAEERADAAVHTAEFMLADTKEEWKSEVEALVKKRVDGRVDYAFQCIAQRIQGVQLSLQATGLGLRDAILDGKIGEGESESTRSRSRSRSPQRSAQGL